MKIPDNPLLSLKPAVPAQKQNTSGADNKGKKKNEIIIKGEIRGEVKGEIKATAAGENKSASSLSETKKQSQSASFSKKEHAEVEKEEHPKKALDKFMEKNPASVKRDEDGRLIKGPKRGK